jgi:hypothetical protein
MPTNILRARAPAPGGAKVRRRGRREVVITVGRVSIRAVLFDTPTAERIWVALPLYSTAETWGESVHFETPVECGRDRTARLNVQPGDICFWGEDDRVIIGFGATPISRPDEIRLPRPCNVFARALDDVRRLAAVTPGEKVSLVRAPGP